MPLTPEAFFNCLYSNNFPNVTKCLDIYFFDIFKNGFRLFASKCSLYIMTPFEKKVEMWKGLIFHQILTVKLST